MHDLLDITNILFPWTTIPSAIRSDHTQAITGQDGNFNSSASANYGEHGKDHMGQLGKWPWCSTTTGQDNALNWENPCSSLREVVHKVWALMVPDLTRSTRTPAFCDTPRRPMITHTSDSRQTPSQNKTKLHFFFLNCQKFKFWNFAINLYIWHTFWSCLITCINMKRIQPEL